MLQQAFWLMQDAIPQLVGSCLVLATRHGLDLPQPVLDLPALADLVDVPIGQCCRDLWLSVTSADVVPLNTLPSKYRACSSALAPTHT